jgi:Pro-kumamolisin, activation domain/Bacterial Ig-like domain (group 3)
MKIFAGALCFSDCIRVLVLVMSSACAAHAQSLPTRLVTQAVDESKVVVLRGTVHPLAQPVYDQGPVSDSLPAQRMLLILGRPPERETALQQFLAAAHAKGSLSYHQWLTPEQFGQQFGPSDADIQVAAGWLSSHGFSISRITQSKRYIEFSGTAGQVRETFRTQIDQYRVKNQTHYANATNISIPESLAPLVLGVSPLNNFNAKPYVKVEGPALYSRSTKKTTPQWTIPNPFGTSNPNAFSVAPEDFATQYDLGPLYAAGTNGAGQTIGIINESNIDLSLVNDYRQLFHLANNPPQVIVDGEDPGTLGGIDIEAYLDVEVSGAVAPDATINLYISNGGGLEDPLALAALRAIEDNQASVLSVSFGECESGLTVAGNQLWAGLWEQAAAQGQTVLVASGDSGATCEFEIGVSGIASTPWDLAVGGTDFFYSDYATGGASALTLWNPTNDSNLGSLKAPLSEQVWNDPFGLDVISDGLERNEFGAGGGGASNCGQPAPSQQCVGYPKPGWQTGPGVPADGARDIPDVALFASNGANLSAYPICAVEGECAAGSGDQAQIFLVGGTSASTPAMAGIMALVNQKYGRQGQADFTLYPLAQQKPAAFHDIARGNNDDICLTDQSTCVENVTTVYSAGAGYDPASGLGSVDANQLVNSWNSVTFLPTSTTLKLSSTKFTHGTPVTVSTAVVPESGSGSPSGAVAILTDSPLPSSQGQATLTLSGGTGSSSIDSLPGGSYQVTARYVGDGTFGSSTSSPVSVTVRPETSAINFALFGQEQQPIGPASGQTGFYGQSVILTVQPNGGATTGAGKSDGNATGSATFTLDSTAQVEPLNAAGLASWTTQVLSVGSHTASAIYSGDASFESSSSTPVTFNVAKGQVFLNVFPAVGLGNLGAIGPSISTGGSLTVSVTAGQFLGGPSGTLAPTGTVQVCLGQAEEVCLNPNYSQTVMLASAGGVNSQNSAGTATFSNLATGGYFLTVQYNGDSNWQSAGTMDAGPFTVSPPPAPLVASTTTLTITPTTISGNQTSTLLAMVTGPAKATIAPTGTINFIDNNSSSVLFFLNNLLPGPGASGTFKVSLPSDSFWANGANQITAVYSGDTNYQGSTSSAVTVNVTQTAGDFTFAPQLAEIVVSSGSSGSAGLNLASLGGFSGNVSLACAPSSTELGCTLSPALAMVNATGTGRSTLTVNAFVPSQTAGLPGTNMPDSQAPQASWGLGRPIGMGIVILGFPLMLAWSRRRKYSVPAVLTVFTILIFQTACGNKSGGSVAPPPSGTTKTPAGTYSVVVAATANGITHDVKVTVIVQ